MNSVGSFIQKIIDSSAFQQLLCCEGNRVELKNVCGSLWGAVVALSSKQRGGVHLVVSDNKDDACYVYNDIYNVLEQYKLSEGHVFLLPTAFKHSILSMQPDPTLIAARTQALSALLSPEKDKPVVICTWAEALGEKVETASGLKKSVLVLTSGDTYDMGDLIGYLISRKFQKVEFVSEPGQFAVRGGIVDIFSYGDNKPYRIEFYDDVIETIRTFRIATQLSDNIIMSASIIASESDESIDSRISLMEYIGKDATIWSHSPRAIIDRINSIRNSLTESLNDTSKANGLYIGGKTYNSDIDSWRQISINGRYDNLSEYDIIDFHSRPQIVFNKDFSRLADNIKESAMSNIETFILSDSYTQIERLDDIFRNLNIKVGYQSCLMPLHEGFSMDLFQAYTDHQIFDRFQRYKIFNEVDKSQSMAISELNSLKVGDYVVHIDNGIGRFGGLVHRHENGSDKEYMKITYGEGDVLMVGVANLHKISKYRSGDGVPPVLKRLGNGAWARTKAIAKSKVKDMARELIKLYAERKAKGGFAFSPDTYLQNEMEASFIWEDTPDQLSATEAVKQDMESPQPMDRLVCGDVGFGKTEVAIRAAFKAVTDGKQVAVLVPTTILALQHCRSFKSRLKDFPVTIESLSRAKTAKQTSEILSRLKDGKIDILVGTHKILGKSVEFKDLGLLIIDEEQKFGVKMKEKLRELKTNVDTLTMTATPIPRTLQFSLLGARDLSIINTPPPNRQPINTEVHPFSDQVIEEAVRYEINRGGQVFFLHNRVSNIYSIADQVRHAVPEAKIVVAHGQMKPDELEKIVLDFVYGEFNVLVCTTIVENGIDIPNANTIVINDAQNFGLSDLHQLRGRVGRGNRKAFCYLLVPSFDILTSDGARRLKVIEEFSELGNGFNIAMEDLDIRGAGNLFGAEQSGFVSEMGYETYQKIIAEAVEELKIEQGVIPQIARNIDCHIETSIEAYLPDDYICSTSEKLRLYKELDSITSDEGIDILQKSLVDRFGPIPEQVSNLIKVVRLRNKAGKMGIEKIIFNPPKARIFFTDDESCPFFQTDEFQGMMYSIVKSPSRFRLEQNKKTSLSISGVSDIDKILDF